MNFSDGQLYEFASRRVLIVLSNIKITFSFKFRYRDFADGRRNQRELERVSAVWYAFADRSQDEPNRTVCELRVDGVAGRGSPLRLFPGLHCHLHGLSHLLQHSDALVADLKWC